MVELLRLENFELKMSFWIMKSLISKSAKKEAGRTLKTSDSVRDIPLIGIGLWAVQRALCQSEEGWLFFHLATVANSRGIQLVNDWLGTIVTSGKTSHSWRHTLKTELNNLGVNPLVRDQILGHSPSNMSRVSAGYDHGRPLSDLRDALEKVTLPMEGNQRTCEKFK